MRGSPLILGPGSVSGLTRYEVRVAGRLGPALRLAFRGWQRWTNRRTASSSWPEEHMQLSVLLAELQRGGIRVVRAHLRRRDT